MAIVREIQIGDQTIKFEFNKFAKQANGSVMVSSGDTQVLVTVCASDEPKPGQGFFPLTVDYIEKFYAAGRIPGGYHKRESKPSDRETLTARVIDRPLRPNFPESYLCETHVVATVMSYDSKFPPAPLALLGASTALMISDIPFDGPIASVLLGLVDGEYVQNPSANKAVKSDLDLNIACKPNAVVMVEAGANFLSEDKMIDAINHAHKLMKPLHDFQYAIQKEIGKAKRVLPEVKRNVELEGMVKSAASSRLKTAFSITTKQERRMALAETRKAVLAEVNAADDAEKISAVNDFMDALEHTVMRESVLADRRRIDGRSLDGIRPISCEAKVLARAHGSSLFTRGETQALASVTLGGGDDELRIDSIEGNSTKRFLLHYNFPPFSVGEARALRGVSRREIGHGALAERALEQVLPNKEDFGYTIRLVSEVLESNGSSSMATVCSGTMALLNAGVPIKEPVAGIAMGLIQDGSRYAVLSDILGDEDHLGDMDFKVCGGERGITALQMDIKTSGLSSEILREALEQARRGRIHILKIMNETINTPSELSDYAPRIFTIKIKPEKVRELIGPGGKVVKRIIAETGVKIDIEDSGVVSVISPDASAAEAAKRLIRSVTSEPEIGGIYLGTVKRVVDFGAFVEIKPGVEGLVHISQLENRRVAKVTDVIQNGEEILVKVIDVDRQGKIKLSRKDALDAKKPGADVY